MSEAESLQNLASRPRPAEAPAIWQAGDTEDLFESYLRDMRRFGRLTSTEELELAQRVAANPKVTLVLDTVVEAIIGDESVAGLRLRDVASGAVRVEPVRGVLFYVGLEPNTRFLDGMVALDASGHIETDVMMAASRPGIFAAGDIRSRSVAQLAAAAGDGATAAIAAFRYLRARR